MRNDFRKRLKDYEFEYESAAWEDLSQLLDKTSPLPPIQKIFQFFKIIVSAYTLSIIITSFSGNPSVTNLEKEAKIIAAEEIESPGRKIILEKQKAITLPKNTQSTSPILPLSEKIEKQETSNDPGFSEIIKPKLEEKTQQEKESTSQKAKFLRSNPNKRKHPPLAMLKSRSESEIQTDQSDHQVNLLSPPVLLKGEKSKSNAPIYLQMAGGSVIRKLDSGTRLRLDANFPIAPKWSIGLSLAQGMFPGLDISTFNQHLKENNSVTEVFGLLHFNLIEKNKHQLRISTAAGLQFNTIDRKVFFNNSGHSFFDHNIDIYPHVGIEVGIGYQYFIKPKLSLGGHLSRIFGRNNSVFLGLQLAYQL